MWKWIKVWPFLNPVCSFSFLVLLRRYSTKKVTPFNPKGELLNLNPILYKYTSVQFFFCICIENLFSLFLFLFLHFKISNFQNLLKEPSPFYRKFTFIWNFKQIVPQGLFLVMDLCDDVDSTRFDSILSITHV